MQSSSFHYRNSLNSVFVIPYWSSLNMTYVRLAVVQLLLLGILLWNTGELSGARKKNKDWPNLKCYPLLNATWLKEVKDLCREVNPDMEICFMQTMKMLGESQFSTERESAEQQEDATEISTTTSSKNGDSSGATESLTSTEKPASSEGLPEEVKQYIWLPKWGPMNSKNRKQAFISVLANNETKGATPEQLKEGKKSVEKILKNLEGCRETLTLVSEVLALPPKKWQPLYECVNNAMGCDKMKLFGK